MIDKKLAKNLHAIILNEYENTEGIVILKAGEIIFEEYFGKSNNKSKHHIASVTKSILSALIGIAIEKGYIKSTEEIVMGYFPEYNFIFPNGIREKVTIQNLLTMTTPYSFDDWNEPLEALCTSPDWIEYALQEMGQNGEIGTFKYSTAGAHLLSAILTRATGRSTREFANEVLFSQIEIDSICEYPMSSYGYDDLFGKKVKGWVHDPNNITTGGWGLTLTVREMARFGQLYLNKGFWNGKQIIPLKWIAQSIKPNLNHYGYMWWLFESNGLHAFAAMGDGGNTICCIPQKDLVVAVASHFIPNPKDRWLLVKDHILPAIC
jgi:CubicO group peptidase (beta-lactamase class C family)